MGSRPDAEDFGLKPKGKESKPFLRDTRFRIMKSSTKDKIKGGIQQVKGAVNEKVGRATGDSEQEDRGTAQKAGGKIRDKVGDIKKVFEK